MQIKSKNLCTGVLFWRGDSLLLIERKKRNPGFAIPAGHDDDDTPEEAGRRESREEVGLVAHELKKLWEGWLDNPCMGLGHVGHGWTVLEATKWSGDIVLEDNEVKSYLWATRQQIQEYARRLEKFLSVNNLTLENLTDLVRATNESTEWRRNPGLEPPMYLIFKKIGLIE